MAWTSKRGTSWTGYYRDDTGRKRSKGGFSRKRDAENWAEEQESHVRRGTHVAPRAGRVTFGAWSEQWKSTLAVSPRTRDTYEERLRSLILPRWASTRLDQISLSMVKDWVATMQTPRGALASETRRRDAAILFDRMLNDAVDEGLLPRNPARKASGAKPDYLPRAPRRKEQRFLSHRELARLSDAMPEEYGRLVLLTGYTGLRFGEMSALRVSDVNVLSGHITVGRAYTRLDDGRVILGGTKNRRERSIVVPRSLRPHLQRAVDGKSRDALIFGARNGEPLRRENFYRRVYEPAVELASNAVLILQTALEMPPHHRTGRFEGLTETALRRFRTDLGRDADSVVDAATWEVLAAGKPALETRRLLALRRVTLRPGDADFGRLTFHDLRHTAASLAVAAGADVKVLQEMLGHAQASVTLDVYTGLFPGRLESVADRLDEHLLESRAHNLPTSAAV